jgi:hypothetical protein
MQRFFGDSRENLLLSLLGDQEITSDELQRLREVINGTAGVQAEASSLPRKRARHNG